MKNFVKCEDCMYWSGQIGTADKWIDDYDRGIVSTVIICAVHINPQPFGGH